MPEFTRIIAAFKPVANIDQMEQPIDLKYCNYCHKEINENYCSNCGHAKELKRIDHKYVIGEIGSVLNFNKGFLYTIKELAIRPGVTIRNFIQEDRNRLVKPVIFIIVCSLIYTFSAQIFNFKDDYLYIDHSKDIASTRIFEWIQNNYGYGNLIMGVFIAFWTKLLFRKYAYNLYEILILLCFVMGIGMLILTFFGAIEGMTNLKASQFGGMAFIIYLTWAIGQFFDKKKYFNYFKAFFSYILGVLTFALATLLIGSLIDLFI